MSCYQFVVAPICLCTFPRIHSVRWYVNRTYLVSSREMLTVYNCCVLCWVKAGIRTTWGDIDAIRKHDNPASKCHQGTCDQRGAFSNYSDINADYIINSLMLWQCINNLLLLDQVMTSCWVLITKFSDRWQIIRFTVHSIRYVYFFLLSYFQSLFNVSDLFTHGVPFTNMD